MTLSDLMGTVYVKSVTATADTAFPIVSPGSEEGEILLTSVNIHCYTNDMFAGNGAYQSAIIRANAVIWFDGIIKISDLWFKNVTGGANGQIVVMGLVKKR